MANIIKLMRDHQVKWRAGNISTQQPGCQNRKKYPWILPKERWEEGLWQGIRSGSSNSLPAYLKRYEIQKHQGVHNLMSSWMLCANLYFPFKATDEGLSLLASFLREHVDARIHHIDRLELEYAEQDALSPLRLLGEEGGGRGTGQTSPDLAFIVNDGKGLVLVENKFMEHSFYSCSARRQKGSAKRPGNPNPDRCKNAIAVLEDPAMHCHQVNWRRKYWERLAPVINREALSPLKCCPAAYAGYQLFRQQALAEGIASSGKYDFVISCVAIDERNTVLTNCLRNTGISSLIEWSRLFNSKAKFTVFTHQAWVSWVRACDKSGQWRDWQNYIENRYGVSNERDDPPCLAGTSGSEEN